MKRPVVLMAGLALTAGSALAEDVAHSDIVFGDYGAIEASLTGVPGDPENGASVMTTRGLGNCIACHAVSALSDHPFHGEVGPSLDGAGSRWTEADLRGIIVDAKNTFPESVMPTFYRIDGFLRLGGGYSGKAPEGPLTPILSAQEIEDVVAYLLTLTDG